MKTEELLKELKETEYYKKFKEEYPDIHFGAGFFILDLENKDEKLQLDFFIPSKKRVAAFEFPWKVPLIHEDEIKEMSEQSLENLAFDIDDLEIKIITTLKEKNNHLKPTRIIAILKGNEWNVTAMDNSLGIIRLKWDCVTGKEKFFESDSLNNIIKIKKN